MVRIKRNRVLLQRKLGALPEFNWAGWRTPDHGAETIVQAWLQTGEQDKSPPGADARILPVAADVAVAGARGGDAAFPRLAARSRPDRTAMADFARRRLGRDHRGHRTRPRCLSAGPQPFPDPARPRSASPDRAADRKGRPAPRRDVDLAQGSETDRGGGAVLGGDLRRHYPALWRAETRRAAGHVA